MGRVQINYKSGRSVEFECEAFSLKRLENGLSCSWKGALPYPLLLGGESIESVWALSPTSRHRNGSELTEIGADEVEPT